MSQPIQSTNTTLNSNNSNNLTSSSTNVPLNPSGSNFDTQPGLTQQQIHGTHSTDTTGYSGVGGHTNTGLLGSQQGSSHVGRDAALGAGVGGIAGHHHGEHHTGRDAALGATAAGIGAHELNKHHHHQESQNIGSSVRGTAFTGQGSAFPIHEHHEHLPHSAYEGHAGRDAALGAGVGGIAGHHSSEGHTARDAALGAAVGEVAGHHAEHSHVGRDSAMGATAAGVGAHELSSHHQYQPQDTSSTVTATEHGVSTAASVGAKPSLADKVGGAIESALGKITHDPAKVEAGHLRKEGLAHHNDHPHNPPSGISTYTSAGGDRENHPSTYTAGAHTAPGAHDTTIAAPSVIGTGVDRSAKADGTPGLGSGAGSSF